jgi:hypothetical protein
MAGLDPAIHVSFCACMKEIVAAWHKTGRALPVQWQDQKATEGNTHGV